MRLLLLAPPGAGKGTQATRLAERYGIAHISSGDLLRREIAAGTDVGRTAAAFVEGGDLVPDDLLLDLVARRVIEAAADGGYVLDGWPRNLAQAEAAYRLAVQLDGVTLQAVLHLQVRRDELVRRMRARAGAEGRSDDTERTMAHRIDVYHELTEPLLGFYADRGILHTIDGDRTPDEVTASITAVLGEAGLLAAGRQ